MSQVVTPAEAVRLSQLSLRLRRLEHEIGGIDRAWIDARIRYEQTPGLHTYHVCEHCQREPCRALMCVSCWGELRELIE